MLVTHPLSFSQKPLRFRIIRSPPIGWGERNALRQLSELKPEGEVPP